MKLEKQFRVPKSLIASTRFLPKMIYTGFSSKIDEVWPLDQIPIKSRETTRGYCTIFQIKEYSFMICSKFDESGPKVGWSTTYL